MPLVTIPQNEDTEKEWYNIKLLIRIAAKESLGTSQKCYRKKD